VVIGLLVLVLVLVLVLLLLLVRLLASTASVLGRYCTRYRIASSE
jgi:hypothetical protein